MLKKSASVKPLDSLPRDRIWLPNSENVLVPVPWDVKLEDFLKYLKQGQEKPAAVLPPAVTNLRLTGTADDVRAILTAEFVIQNLQDDEFVPLPLALHEAVLRDDWVYEGPGNLSWKQADPTQEKSWWLRGTGKHQLTLKLSVPVKKQGTNRRLQLTLPFATASELNLTTNFSAVTVKETQGDIDVVTAEGKPAQIKKWGLGGRLDLTWQPVIAEFPVAPELEVDTDIRLQPKQDELLLVAQQQINVVQGAVSEVVVRLPSQFRSYHVTGSRDYRAHRDSPEDRRRVVVQLNGPTTGRFQLEWTVHLAANDLGKFELDGFVVEQARRQNGRIGLFRIEDLRLIATNPVQPNLGPINAAAMGAAPPWGRVSNAYSFYNQPFSMTLGIEKIEPSFTVEPQIRLNVSAEELTLEVLFAIQVLRGNLTAVDIDWPGWKSDGWELDERINPAPDDDPATPESAAGQLRLRLPEDHPGRVTVRIKARRTIRPGEPIPISLPAIPSPDGAQTRLILADAANVSSDLTSVGDSAPLVLSADPFVPDPEKSPATLRKERAYDVLPGEHSFSLHVSQLEQKVQTASVTTLTFQGPELRGTQHLTYDVQHERLVKVRLEVPEAWQTRDLQFRLDPDRSLPVEWTAGLEDGTVLARLALPEPRLGKFTIQALWTLPLSAEALSGETSLEIPIFQDSDHPASQTELQVSADDAAMLSLTDTAWKPRTELAGNVRWSADSPVTSATLQLDSDTNGTQPFLITGADISADWDRQGSARCEARYHLSGWVSRIGLVLPVDAGPPQVTWDGRSLSTTAEIQAEGKPRDYTLRVPVGDADPLQHVLVVRYGVSASQSFGVWNRWTVAAPQLPQGQWMAEGNWQLRIPNDQHLFGYSTFVTPRFTWQRTGMVFSRVSRPANVAHGNQNIAESAGNLYAFSQYGEIREFRYSTMSQPMILLIGASVSLITGFLLINVSWLRHILTVWCGVFLLAVAGLWIRPQLEVLLQPILIGCLFPLLAVWIQNSRRRDIPPVLSFDPLMDLVESRSSVSRVPYPGEEPREDPVLLRSPTGSTHDFLQAEARSGLP